MRTKLVLLLFALAGLTFFLSHAGPTLSAASATVYISPTGSDSNNGLATTTPVKTFNKAFSLLAAGGTLYLLDGTYTESTTGSIHSEINAPSGVPPDGLSATQLTTVAALNEGRASVQEIWLGTISITKRFMRFRGFTVKKGVKVYHGDHMLFKNMGVTDDSGENSIFGIGSNDGGGNMVSSYITIEDSWIWGNSRKAFGPLNSDHIILRRVILRNDGCLGASHYCASNSGNYMSASTVYNSSQVSLQNVIAVDNIVGAKGYNGGADFWTAWHTNGGSHKFGANEWLGSISLNSEYAGFVTDTDPEPGVINPAATYRDNVAWKPKGGPGFSAQCSGCSNQQGVFENLTAFGAAAGRDVFNLHYAQPTPATNLIALGIGSYGWDGNYAPRYIDNAVSPAYSGASCSVGCKTSNAISDGSIKYIARIEAGSPLKGTALNGADYGANVLNRYGSDGTFHGDANFNTITSTSLWPWPNDARLKQEMCTDAGVTRGFCAAASLTDYIWGYLGNPNPYSGSSGTAPEAPTNLRIVPGSGLD